MVLRGVAVGRHWIHTIVQRIQEQRLLSCRTGFLYFLSRVVQRGLGSTTDQPHEFGPFLDLFSEAKGSPLLNQDKLNNLRNLFTFISNFLVLGIGLIIFPVMSDLNIEYKLIAGLVLGLGICTSIFFLYRINEVKLT